MNIFTMLSSSRDSNRLAIGNVIKVYCLHTELWVSTLVPFIFVVSYLH